MADTQGVKIDVAETKRVLACFFDILEDYEPADAFDFVAKGLKLLALGDASRLGVSDET